MSDAIFYNTIAWRLTGFSNYSASVARFINTWFVDPATSMNPNCACGSVHVGDHPPFLNVSRILARVVNYAQLLRGPGVQAGRHEGVLDLKCMAKIASAVLTLRLGGSPEWTTQIDRGFTQWVSQYIVWMTNSTLAYQERTSVKYVPRLICRDALRRDGFPDLRCMGCCAVITAASSTTSLLPCISLSTTRQMPGVPCKSSSLVSTRTR
jgi:Alginate lyase